MYNEELHNLFSSLNIFGVIKFRIMWWVGHIQLRGEMRNAYKVLV
jgi:hypothetical protein